MRRRTLGKGLIEKMASRNAPKSWLVSVRNMHRTIRKLMEDKREYSLLIDTLAREKELLQAVVRATQNTERRLGTNTREIREALAALPEHLK